MGEEDWGAVEDYFMDFGGEDFALDPYADETQYGDESQWWDGTGEDDVYSLDDFFNDAWGETVDGGSMGDDETDTTSKFESTEISASDESGDTQTRAESMIATAEDTSGERDIAEKTLAQASSVTPSEDPYQKVNMSYSSQQEALDNVTIDGKTGAEWDSERNRDALEGGDYGKNEEHTKENDAAYKDWSDNRYSAAEQTIEENTKTDDRSSGNYDKPTYNPDENKKSGSGSGMGRGMGAGLGKAGEKMADYKTAMDVQKLKGKQSLEEIEARKAKARKRLWIKPSGKAIRTYSGDGIVNRRIGA